MSYAFLADAKIQQRASDTFDDDKMFAALMTASQRVNTMFTVINGWNYFEPYVGTRSLLLTSDIVSAIDNRIDLDYPLLELTSVNINGCDITSRVTTSAFTGAVANTPTMALYLTATTHCSWFGLACAQVCNSPVGVNITGIFGMAKNWVNAFQDEDTIQDVGGIDNSEIVITVANTDGSNFEQLSPRFSRGQLIRIDNEYMRVVGVDNVANTITVRRAQNGTSSAIHAKDATISIFYPEHGIRQAVAAQAASFYERRGAFNNASFDGMTLTQYPTDLIPQLYGVLQEYVNI